MDSTSRHDFADEYSDITDDEDSGNEEQQQTYKKNIRGRFGEGILQAWDPVYVVVCTTGLFIDPLFFYAISISDSFMCVFIDGWFAVTVTVVRCMTDVLYVTHLWLQFKLNRWSRHDVRLRRVDDRWSCNVADLVLAVTHRKRVLLDLFVIIPIPQVYSLTLLH